MLVQLQDFFLLWNSKMSAQSTFENIVILCYSKHFIS